MREVWFQIESPTVYVVPNFISEGYFTRTVIPRELGLDGKISNLHSRTVFYCDPVGSHPAMTEVLLARALSAASATSPKKTSLLIVGHGTSLDKNSSTAAQKQAEAIREKNIFGEVLACFMEEPPSVADWSEITSFPSVVVVPFFISDGLHSYEDIPALLGIDALPPLSKNDASRHKLFSIKGKHLHYTNAIGTDPLMEHLFLDQVRALEKTFSPLETGQVQP